MSLVAFLLVGACATSRWPDEPGKPVPVAMADNVEAGDQFLDALTAARQQHGLAPPVTVPRYQSEIRSFADDLQQGKTSAPGAQRAIKTWGQLSFQAPVDTWLLDCNPGHAPELPDPLVSTGTAVIAYAAAHFHPNSVAADQCVVLVVSRKSG
ncbi:MAG TPA: hypothetical protein VN962_08650 [Polyangia bacterium]|nr:hypothetical protein [Polyangia bacterium]